MFFATKPMLGRRTVIRDFEPSSTFWEMGTGGSPQLQGKVLFYQRVLTHLKQVLWSTTAVHHRPAHRAAVKARDFVSGAPCRKW